MDKCFLAVSAQVKNVPVKEKKIMYEDILHLYVIVSDGLVLL